MNTLWTSTQLPDDVKETVRKHRTMSEIIRDLGEQHERHVLDIAATDARYDAWSAHIDALCADWDDHVGRCLSAPACQSLGTGAGQAVSALRVASVSREKFNDA